MKIAVDAAGGDYAPHEVVKGAINAVHEYGVEIALVGRKNVLRVLAEKSMSKTAGITIVDAKEVIDFNEHPMKAVQGKPNSSIVVGIKLVKSGDAQAFVSAGNTGAVVVASLLTLGRANGVSRPAIGCFLDTISSFPALLVDAGANADCRAEHLVEFARLGSLYSHYLLKIEKPRVGLLCNGSEEGKGNRLAQETYELLKNAADINFIGNIEGHDIVKRTTDVIVTDGFTGNILLKAVEGLGESFIKLKPVHGSQVGDHKLTGKALLASVGMDFLIKGMDYTEYGGACLLGVKGNVIISHGRSKAKAVKNAIGLAKRTAERDVSRMLGELEYERSEPEV